LGIRFRLACLVAACVLPVWLAAGFLVYHAYQNKRELIDSHMLDTARALALVTDKELGNIQASLTVLATSPSLDSGDLAAFHRQAQMVLRDYAGGDIILADATGQESVNSFLPFGTTLPKRNVPDAVRRVYATGKPSITNLFIGAVTGRPLIGVDVPVFRNGRVIYDLTMTLPADRLAAILLHQRLPPEWIGTIMDSNYVTVARTLFPEKVIGQRATNAAKWAAATEGTETVTNNEGTLMFDAFSRSADSGWTVVIGVPESIVRAELQRWLWWTIAGMVLLSFTGVWLALLIARNVARIEEALRRNREWLHVTLTSIGDAVLTADQSGRVTFLNPVASWLTGWEPQQAQGQPSRSVLQVINEQTREPAEDVVARVLREGRGVALANHTALVAKNGREIPIEDSAAPILDRKGNVVGAVLVFHDVAEKRQAQEALQQSEAQFRTLADSIPQLVWMANADGWIFWYNQRWYEYTGTTPQQMEGWGWQSVHDPAELPIVMERWKASIASGEPFDMVFPLRGADGVFHPFLSRAVPLFDSQGRVVRWFGTNTDISAQKQAEEALLRSEKLASVGRMASSIAHEINNPLETIGHAVYLASTDSGISEQGKSYLNMAVQELERVTHITRQTLAFHRENRTPMPIDLRECIDSALKLFANRLRSREITVETRYLEVERVTAHSGEIRQVIANLISNSMDAVPRQGKILLRLSRSIAKDGSRLVRFTIGDTGSGIPRERLEKIFEPFFTTKDVVGTGLGLWITKQIIEKHKARIRVRSKSGRGTVFSISFPTAEVATQVL
jgi:PAS domain S-box-containing protein